MIPRDFITEWREHAPWVQDLQVEQDLVICRALVAIFSVSGLAESLSFRGGTALYLLHIEIRLLGEDPAHRRSLAHATRVVDDGRIGREIHRRHLRPVEDRHQVSVGTHWPAERP